ncbi:hypothetical protein [Leuconostoc lactis]|uniref:hypothetical protein n=1 Tax=Leuconostoc lactis TaxID=1246 RepID=UPI0025B0D0BD|nr:hypothetical protein [Leuconostoc lactis]MDN2649647.1 hypothetical protein [Leuconostoc lactis]
MNSYHATYSYNVDSIKKNGFRKKRDSAWPGDLGNGVYSYIDPDDENLFEFSAKELAYLFVANGKNQYINKKIVTLNLDLLPNMTILDLTDPVTKASFQKLKVSIKRRFMTEKILDQYEASGAKNRGNTDGLFFEYLFKHYPDYGLNPDAVMSDTLAKIESKYYLSGFPNGRELSIRNLDVILNITVV